MADNQDAIELQRRARRRLVGAIALVVFVVIALPIIFDREPKPITQDLTIQIPSQDSSKFSSRVLPTQPDARNDSKAGPAPALGSAASPAGTATSSIAPAVPAPADRMDKAGKSDSSISSTVKAAAEPVPAAAKADPIIKPDAPKDAAKAGAAVAQPEQKTVAKADTARPLRPAPAPAPAPAQAQGAESFFIPLGLFRNPGNVQKVRGWVTAAGYKSFTEPDSAANGVKVMAGPFPTREAAEKARDKLKSKGVDVGVVAAR